MVIGKKSNRIHSIEDCKKIAKERDGLCLSKSYKNSHFKLKWKCNKDNTIWYTPYTIIQQGKWCPKCGREKMIINRKGSNSRNTIHIAYKIAKKRNGKCLSNAEEYKNAHSKLIWYCNKHKNIWSAKFHDIQRGTWCPECVPYKSENLCREYLKNKTGFSFPKKHIKQLNNCELDGYCRELNFAFEYNGLQHYKYIPYFHKYRIKNFKAQQKRDRLKRNFCKKQNIKLIKIPYKYNSYDLDKLYKYIDEQLESLKW